MTLNPSNPASPSPSDWSAIVGAMTNRNQSGYTSGLTAHAGGGATAALQLLQSASITQVDTVATGGDSVQLPPAVPGAMMQIINNGANSLNVFGTIPNNTTTRDTINGSASAFAVAAGTMSTFSCAKLGNWGAK